MDSVHREFVDLVDARLSCPDAESLALVQGGNLEIARRLAAGLARWFPPGHADHMDSALAHWLVKRRHGGAPIVLKRGIVARRWPGAFGRIRSGFRAHPGAGAGVTIEDTALAPQGEHGAHGWV